MSVTGKTFVINLPLSKVRSDNIVLVVVSRVAVTLLDGAATAHSWFKILIDIDVNLTFNIPVQSSLHN